jgi:hypothetical protein
MWRPWPSGSTGESVSPNVQYSTVEAVLSLYGLLQHGTKMSHKIKDLASKARKEVV